MANSRYKPFAALFVFITFLLMVQACSDVKSGQPPKKPAVPVTAEPAVQKPVPVSIRAIGTVEPFSTVSVKAQVGGELAEVHFREGQDVNKGDLLFTIDPRPYEAAIRQYEANLAKDVAQMKNAKEEEQRYSELAEKGYVAKQEYDRFRTNSEALEAVVKADKAVLENARLQYDYCFIHAPIGGRTGSLLVNEGNVIKANADNPMVVINRIRPVYVSFSIPEQHLSDLENFITAGALKVEASIPGTDTETESGVLTFINNTVDTSTGMIGLKGTFPNDDKNLWPGQFVDVVLNLTSIPDAVLVPSQAVQTGQEGKYVFVVKEDGTVETRQVETGLVLEKEIVIKKGVSAGEVVVTDGQLRLSPGAQVEIRKNISPDAAAAPPLPGEKQEQASQ